MKEVMQIEKCCSASIMQSTWRAIAHRGGGHRAAAKKSTRGSSGAAIDGRSEARDSHRRRGLRSANSGIQFGRPEGRNEDRPCPRLGPNRGCGHHRAAGRGRHLYALPPFLTLGPRWLLLAVVVLLLIRPLVPSHGALPAQSRPGLRGQRGHHARPGRVAGASHQAYDAAEAAPELASIRRSALARNILVFACGIGDSTAASAATGSPGAHTEGAFLFPQMTKYRKRRPKTIGRRDHRLLFIAFNMSTAFSPSDTPYFRDGQGPDDAGSPRSR